ncbi:MAG: sulfurtransferase [Methylothermaceae bacteria B42]|nr:MAG: sulfurtransferase [Methylothermaceae bacteria B42]HHJ40524.1 sulfurtransferase complex subunit TusD [Methylothermaceae bacterium]
MKYLIQINSSPYHSEAADTAYFFVTAVLAKGHQILRVFFYQDGVYHALNQAAPPGDEPNKIERWSELAVKHGIDLVICSAAALRRGVWKNSESQLAPGFRVAGLALSAEAMIEADRVMVFK